MTGQEVNEMNNPLKMKICSVTLDCADADALADFYAALLGWEKNSADPAFIGVSVPGEMPVLWFQRVQGYRPPVWPEEPGAQQTMAHLDFVVNDIGKAIQHAVACGAMKSAKQFYADRWTVMFDPAGHPFCLGEYKAIFDEGVPSA